MTLRLVIRRTTLTATSPSGLEWTIRRLVLPLGLRPHPTDVLEMARPQWKGFVGVTGPLPLGYLVLPGLLPFLPVLAALRSLRLLPWTLEARAHPWGRLGPPVVHAYAVRGRAESGRALRQLAQALARGDGAPELAGATRLD